MRKLAIPALALMLFALAAAAAQARNVVGARVNVDPAAVRAYWTPERMRAAVPMDIVGAGSPRRPHAQPAPGAVGGSTGTPARVTWPLGVDLTYTNGKVYFSNGDTRYECSGTAINSTNGSVVWTAGHCVNDGGHNRFYTNWMFVPALNSPVSYPAFVASQLYTSAEWANDGEFGKDYGAAVVGPQNGKTLEATLGDIGRDLGFTPDYTIGRPLDAYGYPAAGDFNGQTLYDCSSAIGYVDKANPDTIGIPCSLSDGSSGGAWIDPANGDQVSNNSYGYASSNDVMYGPVFGDVAADLLHTAEGTAPPGTIVGG